MPIAQTESLKVNKVRYVMTHHAVLKPDKYTTKLRVVYDASAPTTPGKTLNDFLLVDEADRNLQCILWRNEPTDSIKMFQLNTVTFGTAAAPFLATRCLKESANLVKDRLPLAARVIANDFFLDEMITDTDDLQTAWNIRNQVVSSLKQVGFNLRKWCSNRPELMDKQDQISSTTTQMVDFGSQEESKKLGIRLHLSTDHLQYNINIDVKSRKVSKRSILSEIAQIFDPLGLLAPAIISAQIIIQQMWELNIGWDETVPQDIYTEWIRYREDLESLNELRILRRVIGGEYINLQLHVFADSSEKAYGAYIYLQAADSLGTGSVRLFCAKSGVTTLKQQTPPNLELCAALLLAELFQIVKESLQVADIHYTFWTDSESVLPQLTDVSHWRHVPSESNPANLVSRGKFFLEDRPAWLRLDPSCWPNEGQTPEEVPRQRKLVMCHLGMSRPSIVDNYANLHDLLRATSSFFRVHQIITRANQDGFKETLSIYELHQALSILIKLSQREEFSSELVCLEKRASLVKKIVCLD